MPDHAACHALLAPAAHSCTSPRDVFGLLQLGIRDTMQVQRAAPSHRLGILACLGWPAMASQYW